MRRIEEILDEVCWNHGFINFQGLQDNLKHPTATGHKELFSIIEESARMYSQEAERYYDVNTELQDKVGELELEVSFLEDENNDLEDKIEYLEGTIKELEDELNELRED